LVLTSVRQIQLKENLSSWDDLEAPFVFRVNDTIRFALIVKHTLYN
jgi:hypothetical protein